MNMQVSDPAGILGSHCRVRGTRSPRLHLHFQSQASLKPAVTIKERSLRCKDRDPGTPAVQAAIQSICFFLVMQTEGACADLHRSFAPHLEDQRLMPLSQTLAATGGIRTHTSGLLPSIACCTRKQHDGGSTSSGCFDTARSLGCISSAVRHTAAHDQDPS